MDIIQRIEEKLDKVGERVSNVDVTLARQAVSLEEHMRRTALLEQRTEQLTVELKPLTRAHNMWSGVGKALAIIGTLVTILCASLKLLGNL
jgi:hypothetical protein